MTISLPLTFTRRSGMNTRPLDTTLPSSLAGGTDCAPYQKKSSPPLLARDQCGRAEQVERELEQGPGSVGEHERGVFLKRTQRRVAVSYSLPVNRSAEVSASAETRTSQILSKEGSNPEKELASSESRSPLARGLGCKAVVTIQGGPTNRCTSACHSLSKAARRRRSMRADGSSER